MVIRPNTYFTITQLVKITRVWASNKVRKANDSGLLGEIVNVAGMHSLRRTAVIEIFEQTRFKTSTSLLGHKNILTTSTTYKIVIQYKTN
jgi:integrase